MPSSVIRPCSSVNSGRPVSVARTVAICVSTSVGSPGLGRISSRTCDGSIVRGSSVPSDIARPSGDSAMAGTSAATVWAARARSRRVEALIGAERSPSRSADNAFNSGNSAGSN